MDDRGGWALRDGRPGRGGLVFAAVWLVFLVDPFRDAWDIAWHGPDPVRGWVGMLATHRSKNASMSPGPSRSQIACSPAGSSQDRNPLANSLNPIPAAVACCLAHSCPFSHTLAGYGK